MKKIIFVLFIVLTVTLQLTANPLDTSKQKWDYSSFNSNIHNVEAEKIEHFSKLCKDNNGSKRFFKKIEEKNFSFKEYKDICLRTTIYDKKIDRPIANLIWIALSQDSFENTEFLRQLACGSKNEIIEIIKDYQKANAFLEKLRSSKFSINDIKIYVNSKKPTILIGTMMVLQKEKKEVAMSYFLHKIPSSKIEKYLKQFDTEYVDPFENISLKIIYFRPNLSKIQMKELEKYAKQYDIVVGKPKIEKFLMQLSNYLEIENSVSILYYIGFFIFVGVLIGGFVWFYKETEKYIERSLLKHECDCYEKLSSRNKYLMLAFLIMGIIFGILMSDVNMNIFILGSMAAPLLTAIIQVVALSRYKEKEAYKKRIPLLYKGLSKDKEKLLAIFWKGYYFLTSIIVLVVFEIGYSIAVAIKYFSSDINFISYTTIGPTMDRISTFAFWDSLFPFAAPQVYEHLTIFGEKSQWGWFVIVSVLIFGIFVKLLIYFFGFWKFKRVNPLSSDLGFKTLSIEADPYNLLYWVGLEKAEDSRKIADDLKNKTNLKVLLYAEFYNDENEELDEDQLVKKIKEGEVGIVVSVSNDHYKGGLRKFIEKVLSVGKDITVYLTEEDGESLKLVKYDELMHRDKGNVNKWKEHDEKVKGLKVRYDEE